jgi:voltage-gated potassium channel
MDNQQIPEEKGALQKERSDILHQVEEMLALPVLLLGFAWLVLLVIDLTLGLTGLLEILFYFIWGVFIFDFLLRFVIAPHKTAFLRSHWLTIISLIIPALRVFAVLRVIRIIRLARAARGINLVRLVGSLNRGMRALRSAMDRRGFSYVLILTFIVTLVGAAGMYTFEVGQPGFDDFGDSLWWTAMIITTMGSGEWPQTLEGRVLGFLLSLYAFAVFGYVTATLATFFIGREAASDEAELVGAKNLEALREEIRALRSQLQNRE